MEKQIKPIKLSYSKVYPLATGTIKYPFVKEFESEAEMVDAAIQLQADGAVDLKWETQGS